MVFFQHFFVVKKIMVIVFLGVGFRFFFGEIENRYIIKRENMSSVSRALAT
jgi:hypothetical protein